DRDAGLDPCELETRRALGRDEVEMRGLAAYDRPERDDARVTTCLRERHRRERQLERARHRQHRDPVVRDARRLERLERPAQELVRDAAVEPRDDDADRAAVAERRAL